MSVSTRFHANFVYEDSKADLALYSPDSVVFYLHRHVLVQHSTNSFGGLLDWQPSQLPNSGEDKAKNTNGMSETRLYAVEQPSEIVNIFLHILYDMDIDYLSPPLHIIAKALFALRKYGITPSHTLSSPSTTIFKHLSVRAKSEPLQVYALAASFGIDDLAVAASEETLPIALGGSITDELANFMGPVYLRRLMALHLERVETLKRLLFQPFEPDKDHECDENISKTLTRAHALKIAYLAWETSPALASESLEQTLSTLFSQTGCPDCSTNLRTYISKLVGEWSEAKASI